MAKKKNGSEKFFSMQICFRHILIKKERKRRKKEIEKKQKRKIEKEKKRKE